MDLAKRDTLVEVILLCVKHSQQMQSILVLEGSGGMRPSTPPPPKDILENEHTELVAIWTEIWK